MGWTNWEPEPEPEEDEERELETVVVTGQRIYTHTYYSSPSLPNYVFTSGGGGRRDADNSPNYTNVQLSQMSALFDEFISVVEAAEVLALNQQDRKALEELKSALEAIKASIDTGRIATETDLVDALSIAVDFFLERATDAFIKTVTTSLGAAAASFAPEPGPVSEFIGALAGFAAGELVTGLTETERQQVAQEIAKALVEGVPDTIEAGKRLKALVESFSDPEAAVDYLLRYEADNPIVQVMFAETLTGPRDDGSPAFIDELADFLDDLSGTPRNGDWREIPPIVIDLDGDGIELVSVEESRVLLDIDGDPGLERVGWASSDDGVLIYDLDGSGDFSHLREAMFAILGGAGASDLDGLATLDANGDGHLTEADFLNTDLSWSHFLVWRDANDDGLSSSDEMFSLDDLGIVSFELVSDGQMYENSGNTVLGEFSVEKTDGTSFVGGDVIFSGFDDAIGSFDFGTDGQVVFNEDGTALIISSSEDDTITDTSGDNLYVFRDGSGQDVILDYKGTNSFNFSDVVPLAFFVGRSEDDLVLSNLQSGDGVRIEDFFLADHEIEVLLGDTVVDAEDLDILLEQHKKFDIDRDGFMDEGYVDQFKAGEIIPELIETFQDIA